MHKTQLNLSYFCYQVSVETVYVCSVADLKRLDIMFMVCLHLALRYLTS